jgi:hypothetical protein
MSFHTTQKRSSLKLQVKFDSLDTAYKSETKFLGRENMKWDVHAKSLSSKLGQICYMIQFLKDVMRPHVIRSFYFAYFHAHLKYGLIFWSGGTESKSIFKLQKWVIRIISRVGIHTSCRQLFSNLHILHIVCLCIPEILCYIKINFEKLKQNTEIHSHSTHQKLNLHVQFCRKNVFKSSVVNIGIKLFNNLPNQIRKLEKIQHFRRKLRYILLGSLCCMTYEIC